MDDLFRALAYFGRDDFDACIDVCGVILENSPYDQAAWCLKLEAMTQKVYVEEFEADEEGIADILMDENSIAEIARPGTSLKMPMTAQKANQVYRPVTHSSRPLSGIALPGTQMGRPSTLEQAIRVRTSRTARPITGSSGRFVRLGTSSMLPHSDGSFLNLARLNVSKYASISNLAKPLFEYIYYYGNDVRQALELGAQATQACEFNDWWWKFQLGKCYYRLGMYRDAERQFKSAIQQQDAIDSYLWLGKVYIRLDQPLTALEVYKQGVEKYPYETVLVIQISRIYEELNDTELAVKYYKDILTFDAIDVEAIACIAMHHFYADQPEIAVRFYRRLLQMGVCSAELYNNLALCCFYSQQYDMAVMCFDRALMMASDETQAEVWYNISHLVVGIGDKGLAAQCYKLALVRNNDHAESYNNLGVIEASKGNYAQAEAFFGAASTVAEHLFEPYYNQALIADQVGDIQSEFSMVKKAILVYAAHVDSKMLLDKIKNNFMHL